MEIRDKLFTEEQYLKQLKMYDEDISYYEQIHLSRKHIGYDSLFNYRLRYLLVQYSMGQDIDNLENFYTSFVIYSKSALYKIHIAFKEQIRNKTVFFYNSVFFSFHLISFFALGNI